MGRIGEKLKCRRGASILLALLFLLVSVLVAMSVLMAAASNAGKIRSNREEQKKYFTLSSALNLVVDELTDETKTYYQGKYTITTTPRTKEKKDASGNIIYKKDAAGNPLLDEDGKLIPETIEYKEYAGQQVEGEFTGQLSSVLPLQNALDALFYSKCESITPSWVEGEDVWAGFKARTDAGAMNKGPYTLELAASGLPEDGKGLEQKVKIIVTVSGSGIITLKAVLDGDNSYISMEARLGVEIPSDAFDLKVSPPEGEDVSKTGKVTWELERIEKKEATS